MINHKHTISKINYWDLIIKKTLLTYLFPNFLHVIKKTSYMSSNFQGKNHFPANYTFHFFSSKFSKSENRLKKMKKSPRDNFSTIGNDTWNTATFEWTWCKMLLPFIFILYFVTKIHWLWYDIKLKDTKWHIRLIKSKVLFFFVNFCFPLNCRKCEISCIFHIQQMITMHSLSYCASFNFVSD